MTTERKIALRILGHAVDNMGYWKENKMYYADDKGIDYDLIDKEIEKISLQIIERYGLIYNVRKRG